tara:strand:- start:493 stop:663 length:171 start_codon:yes stop_codon:yes gene_type:complete
MNTKQVTQMTDNQILEKIKKLESVIKRHPQKSMKAKAGGTKAVLCNELARRFKRAV